LEAIIIFENLDVNLKLAFISAGAALLGSIIGAIATLAATWMGKKIQHNGKVRLFAKIVHSKGKINEAWGFYKNDDDLGLYFTIPIWLDVCNTCGVSRVIRDVNLIAYLGGREVASLIKCKQLVKIKIE
jgi:hypothetical protein